MNNKITWDNIHPDSSQTTPTESINTTPVLNWEEIHPTQENTQPQEDSHPPEDISQPQNFNDYNESDLPNSFSSLGSVNKIQINTDLYTLNFNTDQLINELGTLTPTPLDEKGRYTIDFSQGEYLNKVILTLKQIASIYNSNLQSCFIYKIAKGDNLLNIYKGKPNNSFIYYLQADQNSSHVINDLSSMGGPSVSQTDPSTGVLNVFPGWVPYSLSTNNSEGDMIAIAGTFK